MKPPITLKTKRLILRPLTMDDLDTLYSIVYSDPDVITFYGGGIKTRDYVRQVLEISVWNNQHQADQGWCQWAPIRRQDGQILGRMGLGSPDRTYYHKPATDADPYTPLDSEIGYAFGKAYWGQGYASEACRAIIDYLRGSMLRIDQALCSDRVLKALTGLSIVEFIDLTARFETVLTQHRSADLPHSRQRQPGGGRQPQLASAEDKLFFILFYIKCYPTFDVAGVLFNVHRSQPHRWVQTELPLLEQTLGEAAVLPGRTLEDVAAFFDRFPEAQNLFIDGQERPTQRPPRPYRAKSVVFG
jgi:RimJ/RimL family protein N-acetyltransferase